MPEILASLAPAALEGAAELGTAAAPAAMDFAGSALPALGGAAADFGAAAAPALGGLAEMSAAGLPFGAGVGELGSVATGLGASGVTPFTDALAALGGSAAGIGGAGGLAGLGAGVGDIGANVAGIGGGLGGLGDAVLPSAAGLTSGVDLPFSAVGGGGANVDPGVAAGAGVTSVGPTAGTPAGAISQGSFAAPAGASAATAAAPAGAAPLDLTSMLSKAVGNANPLGLALAAGGLGYNILQGQKETASTGAIKDQAGKVAGQASDLMGQGKQLTSHLESGTLPPNIQQQVEEQTKAAKAKIVSNYAAQGMNTDPNRNSSLRQELASVDRQAKVMSGQLAQQLAQSGATLINAGTQLTGLDNNLLTTLSNIDSTQTARVGQAIANFAGALNGNKGGVTLQLGPTK